MKTRFLRGGLAFTTVVAVAAAVAQGQSFDIDDRAADPLEMPSLDEVWESPDGIIHAGRQTFRSWSAYFQSDFFRNRDKRCGAPTDVVGPPGQGGVAGTAADCSLSSTNPAAEYGPANGVFVIDVVIHNIASNSGTGFIDDAQLASQIDILNEDFNALAGSLGAPGTDCAIEFRLASVDPNGNPTTGINHYFSNKWYNDRGNYKSQLSWDTNRYLNIYTNTAGGNLGYVEGFPQQGIVGAANDGVVCNWTAFGRNSSGAPYDLGRTATHEVGHYLGLLHTFQSGCGTSDCSTSGDLVCDTNPESSPNYSSCGRTTCGSPDPVKNYMDYSEDACMDNFTPDQAARMRCVLIHYREDLWINNGGGGGGGGGGGDPVGACCVGTSCGELTEADCGSAGGTWLGAGTVCETDTCGGGGGGGGGDPFDATLEAGVVTQGSLVGGSLGSLGASDDDRVVLGSAAVGNRQYTEIEATFSSATAATSMQVTVETSCTTNRAKTAVEIFDFAGGGWVRLARYNESGSDSSRTFDISNAAAFVDGAGAISVRVRTDRRGGSFQTSIDQIRVVVTP
ncbi:MAG: zinc metalloprotease [Planctomycetota bacterium]|nr:zinc metalloprotease [Planctomycetota bacterium]